MTPSCEARQLLEQLVYILQYTITTLAATIDNTPFHKLSPPQVLQYHLYEDMVGTSHFYTPNKHKPF